MKKLFSRVLSFGIDIFICTLLIVGLSNINLINPNKSKIDEQYNSYSTISIEYEDFNKYLEDVIKDAKLDEQEHTKINKDFSEYAEIFEDINLNEEITNKEKDKLRNEAKEKYVQVSNDYGYRINKLNIYQTIISIVVYILYFGLLQWLLKGQTIGKKIFKLRVINDNGKSVPLWKFIVRAILIAEIIIIGLDLILVLVLNKNSYLVANYHIANFKYLYEMAFLVCMIIRDDQKSLHDLLLHTRVLRFDKDGNEINEVLFVNSEEEIVEEKKEKIKNRGKKKEVVEAIKVDDKKHTNKNN